MKVGQGKTGLRLQLLRGLVLIAVATLSLQASAQADSTYVSLRGGFYFDYPDDWAQVDYLTVDYYLRALGADSSAFDYDAVFAAKKPGGRFHDHEYMILTVEPVGTLTRRQRDSIVAELADVNPQWNKQTNVVTVVNDDPASPKTTMLTMKFYDKGLAQFYFFAPDSTFGAYRPVFDEMVASFSTENVSAMLPKEEVKLADPDRIATGDEEASEDESGESNLIWYATLAVIIILMIVIMRKKRARA